MQIHFLTALWIVGDGHKTEVYENLRYRNRLKLVFSYDISNLILTISRAYLLIVVDLDYKTGYHYESITPFSEIKASLIWLRLLHTSVYCLWSCWCSTKANTVLDLGFAVILFTFYIDGYIQLFVFTFLINSLCHYLTPGMKKPLTAHSHLVNCQDKNTSKYKLTNIKMHI